MNKLALTLAIALALPSTAALAAGENESPAAEDMQARIETMLTEQGYEVRRIQMEDGLYEAYALRDGERFEIYLDDTLTVQRIVGGNN